MKKLRDTTILVLLSSSFIISTYGQSVRINNQFLRPGDTMPNLSFRIHNYKTPYVKMSDFKGKMVIFDIWGITCSSCIAAMPHMQELQKKFPDKLQIIMLTKDSPKAIEKRASHAINIRDNKLPSVMGDDSLAYRFNYIVMPTHVWIGTDGVIKYITSSVNTNEKNIKAFLNGNDLNLMEKKDISINHSDPLIVGWWPYYKNISFYTYLAPAQTKYHTSGFVELERDDEGIINRLSVDVTSLSGLYKLAYGLGSEYNKFSESRVIMNFDGWGKYVIDPKKDYKLGGLYYILDVINNNKTMPDGRFYKLIQNQLDLYFGIKSSWEKRKIECYVLKRIPRGRIPITGGDAVKAEWQRKIYKINNVPWEAFISTLNNITTTPLQLLDETGINPNTKVNVKINTDWNDLDVVNSSLQPYGLKVTMEKRELDCIVLNDDVIVN